MDRTIHERLVEIQQSLKAPKNQRNTFGNYDFRSCEDIIEAVKPLLNGLSLTLSDSLVSEGSRFYIQAAACLSDGKDKIVVTALAREAETQKGMNEAQITGSASSYARKYALNGLFAIDDTKDADTMDNRNVSTSYAPVKAPESKTTTASTALMCEIHNKPMKQRTGQNGGHYYDHRWQENDIWQKCNGKPRDDWDGEIPSE